MEKTKITHVNDGLVFVGHRIIRKRSRYGDMRVITTIRDKARRFAASLTALLSGNHSESKIDMVESVNRKLKGWAAFINSLIQSKVFSYIDRVVFWKLAHWLAQKYRSQVCLACSWPADEHHILRGICELQVGPLPMGINNISWPWLGYATNQNARLAHAASIWETLEASE